MLLFRAHFARKDLERNKNCLKTSLKFKVATYISELLNLGMEIKTPNSTLHYENFPELPFGFFYRFFIITISINMSVFFSYTKKPILLKVNYLFLKGKFSHMRWQNTFLKMWQYYNFKFVICLTQLSAMIFN